MVLESDYPTSELTKFILVNLDDEQPKGRRGDKGETNTWGWTILGVARCQPQDIVMWHNDMTISLDKGFWGITITHRDE